MSHPFQEHRADKVEKRRMSLYRKSGGRIGFEEDSSFESDGEIERDSAHRGDRGHGLGNSPSRNKSGGRVDGQRKKHRMDHKRAAGGATYKRGGRAHGDEKEDRALIKKMMKEEKGKAHRARGGRTKHKGKTNIHINIGQHPPQQAAPMPALPPPPPPRPPMMPPGGPPPGGPPGLAGAPPMGGPPPGLPPGMPPPGLRKSGGRVKNASNAVKPAKAPNSGVHDMGTPLSGARSTPGDKMPGNPPGWTEGEKHKTKVQHTDGKTDGPDIGRPKPITYRRGGGVKGVSKPIAPAKGISGPPATVSRATSTVPGSPAKVSRPEPANSPRSYPIKAGSRSGVGRLEKARAGASGQHVP